MNGCPRCGGVLLEDYEDLWCVCGWRGLNILRPDTPSLDELDACVVCNKVIDLSRELDAPTCMDCGGRVCDEHWRDCAECRLPLCETCAFRPVNTVWFCYAHLKLSPVGRVSLQRR